MTTGNPAYGMLLLHSDSCSAFQMAGELQIDTRRCLVSFKLLQFPQQSSTRSARVPVRWMDLDSSMGTNRFLSSWLGDNNDSDEPKRRLNWGALAGLAISFVISGGFWAGVGVLIARAVK
jgi:hypothetical protein